MAIKRTNYFSGQFLKEEEFRTESEYLVNYIREHNKTMHTWGVVRGLDLTINITSSSKIDVAAGVALNKEGKFMYYDGSTSPLLIDNTKYAGLSVLFVTIQYNEILDDMQTYGDKKGYTKINEKPIVQFRTSMPTNPSMELILGTVILDGAANPVIAIDVNHDLRKISGLKAGGLKSHLTKFPIVAADGTLFPEANWPFLQGYKAGSDCNLQLSNTRLEVTKNLVVSGEVSASQTPAHKLDITGSAAISGDVNISANGSFNATNVTGTQNITGNLDTAGALTTGTFNTTGWAELEKLHATGPVTIEGDLNLSGMDSAITLNGLDVQGATATIESPQLKVKDSYIRVNQGNTQTTGGVEVFRGVTAAASQVFWDDNLTVPKWQINRKGQTEEILSKKALAELLIGTVMPFGTNKPIPGWLLCDGQAVSRTTYSALYAVILGTYGEDPVENLFNVPNLHLSTPTGYDPSGLIYNSAFGAKQDGYWRHKHSFSKNSNYNGGHHHAIPGLEIKGSHKHTLSGTTSWSRLNYNYNIGCIPIRFYIKY